MLSAGGSFQWFRNQLGAGRSGRGEEAERSIRTSCSSPKPPAAPPGCEGLFFLPYLTGERCPHPDPTARGGWIGLTSRTTRAMLIRSLLEGVTFGMRDALEIMRQMDIPITQVRASGGGARSEFWRQLQADIYKRRSSSPTPPKAPPTASRFWPASAPASGAASRKRARRRIKQTAKISPSRKSSTSYDRYFQTYGKLYFDLKSRFSEIAGL